MKSDPVQIAHPKRTLKPNVSLAQQFRIKMDQKSTSCLKLSSARQKVSNQRQNSQQLQVQSRNQLDILNPSKNETAVTTRPTRYQIEKHFQSNLSTLQQGPSHDKHRPNYSKSFLQMSQSSNTSGLQIKNKPQSSVEGSSRAQQISKKSMSMSVNDKSLDANQNHNSYLLLSKKSGENSNNSRQARMLLQVSKSSQQIGVNQKKASQQSQYHSSHDLFDLKPSNVMISSRVGQHKSNGGGVTPNEKSPYNKMRLLKLQGTSTPNSNVGSPQTKSLKQKSLERNKTSLKDLAKKALNQPSQDYRSRMEALTVNTKKYSSLLSSQSKNNFPQGSFFTSERVNSQSGSGNGSYGDGGQSSTTENTNQKPARFLHRQRQIAAKKQKMRSDIISSDQMQKSHNQFLPQQHKKTSFLYGESNQPNSSSIETSNISQIDDTKTPQSLKNSAQSTSINDISGGNGRKIIFKQQYNRRQFDTNLNHQKSLQISQTYQHSIQNDEHNVLKPSHSSQSTPNDLKILSVSNQSSLQKLTSIPLQNNKNETLNSGNHLTSSQTPKPQQVQQIQSQQFQYNHANQRPLDIKMHPQQKKQSQNDLVIQGPTITTESIVGSKAYRYMLGEEKVSDLTQNSSKYSHNIELNKKSGTFVESNRIQIQIDESEKVTPDALDSRPLQLKESKSQNQTPVGSAKKSTYSQESQHKILSSQSLLKLKSRPLKFSKHTSSYKDLKMKGKDQVMSPSQISPFSTKNIEEKQQYRTPTLEDIYTQDEQIQDQHQQLKVADLQQNSLFKQGDKQPILVGKGQEGSSPLTYINQQQEVKPKPINDQLRLKKKPSCDRPTSYKPLSSKKQSLMVESSDQQILQLNTQTSQNKNATANFGQKSSQIPQITVLDTEEASILQAESPVPNNQDQNDFFTPSEIVSQNQNTSNFQSKVSTLQGTGKVFPTPVIMQEEGTNIKKLGQNLHFQFLQHTQSSQSLTESQKVQDNAKSQQKKPQPFRDGTPQFKPQSDSFKSTLRDQTQAKPETPNSHNHNHQHRMSFGPSKHNSIQQNQEPEHHESSSLLQLRKPSQNLAGMPEEFKGVLLTGQSRQKSASTRSLQHNQNYKPIQNPILASGAPQQLSNFLAVNHKMQSGGQKGDLGVQVSKNDNSSQGVQIQQDWINKLKLFLNLQQNLAIKILSEFKKTKQVTSLIQDIDEVQNLTIQISRHTHQYISENQELLFTIKQHCRAYLCAFTLLWFIQNEECKVLESQNGQVYTLIDQLGNICGNLQDLITTSDIQLKDFGWVNGQNSQQTDKQSINSASRSKQLIRQSFSQIITLLKKICRQASAKVKHGERTSINRKSEGLGGLNAFDSSNSSYQLQVSKEGIEVFQNVIEIVIQIEDSRKISGVKARIIEIISKFRGKFQQDKQRLSKKRGSSQARPETSKIGRNRSSDYYSLATSQSSTQSNRQRPITGNQNGQNYRSLIQASSPCSGEIQPPHFSNIESQLDIVSQRQHPVEQFSEINYFEHNLGQEIEIQQIGHSKLQKYSEPNQYGSQNEIKPKTSKSMRPISCSVNSQAVTKSRNPQFDSHFGHDGSIRTPVTQRRQNLNSLQMSQQVRQNQIEGNQNHIGVTNLRQNIQKPQTQSAQRRNHTTPRYFSQANEVEQNPISIQQAAQSSQPTFISQPVQQSMMHGFKQTPQNNINHHSNQPQQQLQIQSAMKIQGRYSVNHHSPEDTSKFVSKEDYQKLAKTNQQFEEVGSNELNFNKLVNTRNASVNVDNRNIASAQKAKNVNSLHNQLPKQGGGNSVYGNRTRQFLIPPLNSTNLLPGQQRKFTLVLDLDETLVHFDQQKRRYRARPHALRFLQEMEPYYELIIFTAGLKEYADWILDDFDKHKLIRYRLYRDSCKFKQGVYLKDLSLLGRDLSKTIIIDNIADNFELHAQNGINILSWFNNPRDNELPKLIPILRSFVENDVLDVRRMINQFFKPSLHGKNIASPQHNRVKKGVLTPTYSHLKL